MTPDSFSKELIFVKKPWTHNMRILQGIFNYFSKIKSSEFSKKYILLVFVIFVLDLIKTSV